MRQAIEILKEDHARILEVLATLERFLKKRVVPNEVLELTLNHLDRELEGHVNREAHYLMSFLYSVTGELRGYHNDRDHQDIEASIQFMRGMLEEDASTSWSAIEASGSHLIEVLREHIAEEEDVVFPIAEKALGKKVLEVVGSQITSDHTVTDSSQLAASRVEWPEEEV